MKRFFIIGLIILFRTIKACLIILMVLAAILVLTNYLGKSMEATPGLMRLNATTSIIANTVMQPVKFFIPTKFFGYDWSIWILIILYWISIILCSVILNRLHRSKQHINLNYYNWRKSIKPRVSKMQIEKIDQKYAELITPSDNVSKKDRKEMLKEFIKLKKELNSMGQECAFLSIDVVNSTGMKVGEDKLVAVHDFDRYNEIAIGCLYENGVIKYTTTPDGIMSCFRTVDDAVKAAVSLIAKIKVFNRKEKHIKMDFQVRCGINSGFVYIEGVPLEQVSDHVIDIAGHMQKNAKPNSINIAGSAIEPLKTRGGFVETTDIIDDKRVYTWHADD